MSDYIISARFGEAVSTRWRGELEPVESINTVLYCQAPAARGFDPELAARACTHKARWVAILEDGDERLIVPCCRMHGNAWGRAGEVLYVTAASGICRVCGCDWWSPCEPPCGWANGEHTVCTACDGERP